ncbi:hypothetical protein YC2023_065162 [Brassica napus]
MLDSLLFMLKSKTHLAGISTPSRMNFASKACLTTIRLANVTICHCSLASLDDELPIFALHVHDEKGPQLSHSAERETGGVRFEGLWRCRRWGHGLTVDTEAFERAVVEISKLGGSGGGQLNVPPGWCRLISLVT